VYAAYERIAHRELQRVTVVRDESSIAAVERRIQTIVAAHLNLTSAPEALVPEEMRANRQGSL